MAGFSIEWSYKMFTKLMDILSLFRKGSEVANKSTWKNVGTATPALAALIMALVKFACDRGWINVQITLEEATQIACGVSTAVLYIVHICSSKHAGILPAQSAPSPVSEPEQENKPKEQNVSSIDEATRKRAEEYLVKNKLFDERN
jgi:hypothetical protein